MGARGGLVSWLLQRLSGVLIVVLLGLHFYITHYTGYVDSAHVLGRLHGNLAWLLTDMALVALVGYHGFNGLRHIVLDYRPSPRTIKAVNAGTGLAFIAFLGLCWVHLYSFYAFS